MIDFIAFPLFVFYCQVIITKRYKCFMEVIMKPKIAVLSTYPPTQCGIATFSQSLVNGFAGARLRFVNEANDIDTRVLR